LSDKKDYSQDEYAIVPEDAPFEHGFNMKTIWGALFVGFIIMPGAIYMGLVTGQSIAGGAEWVTIILFIEMGKRTFVRLKTQEIIILYWVCGGLVQMGGKLGSAVNLFGGPFGGLIWDQYLVQSPQAIGLAEYIPDWVAPPKGSEALAERTFLHPAWIKPIVILIIVMVFSRVCSLSMSYVLYRITFDIERLPFPMARVQAGGCTALAETSAKAEGWRWRVFSIGSFVGAIWGLILVVVPTLSGIFLTDTWMILPIPFVDFTTSVKTILPATPLGLSTQLGGVFTGFVLPFWVVLGQFVASMIVTFVANPLLYKHGILHSWSPGMSSIPTAICNRIDFWLSFGIGTAFVVAFLGFGLVAKAFISRKRQQIWEEDVRADSDEFRVHPERGDIPIWLALTFWFIGTLVFVLLVRYLVPDFPWWICAIFGFIWSPIYSYIAARMVGLTGNPRGVSFPYLREGSFYLSGYKGASVWFAPIPLRNDGGGVAAWRQLELTHTKFGSMIWQTAVSLIVMLICSFIFWSMIWKLQPIPSSAYPFVQKMWPFHATMQSLWAKSTIPEQTPICDFEGADSAEVETVGLNIKASTQHPMRELRSLRLEPKPDAEIRRITFSSIEPTDWIGNKWLVSYFFVEEGTPEVIFRIKHHPQAAQKEHWETKLRLKKGKNIIGVRLVEPSPKDKFAKQLPERAVAGANIVEIPFSEFKTTAGEVFELEGINQIEFEFPGKDKFVAYLDNVTLLGEARSFITKFINFNYILAGFGVGWLVYGFLALIGASPLIFYGMVSGANIWAHYTIPMFIGALLGRYYFRKRFGEAAWRAYAPILSAGYWCGFSLIGMTSVGIKLIATSISSIVF